MSFNLGSCNNSESFECPKAVSDSSVWYRERKRRFTLDRGMVLLKGERCKVGKRRNTKWPKGKGLSLGVDSVLRMLRRSLGYLPAATGVASNLLAMASILIVMAAYSHFADL